MLSDAQSKAQDNRIQAKELIRKCVHCGFCNATCPTYQLTGDELDGPRGRIYLIREFLENQDDENRLDRASLHLDRCLTCRSCETTCPSGVQYGHIAELGREAVRAQSGGMGDWTQQALVFVITRPLLMATLLLLGKPFAALVPARLRRSVAQFKGLDQWLAAFKRGRQERRTSEALPRVQALESGVERDGAGDSVDDDIGADSMELNKSVLLLRGCAERVMTPETGEHVESLLADLGYDVVYLESEQCCGSLELHFGAEDAALAKARHNVDALYSVIANVRWVVSSASGCGVTVHDYDRLLANDPVYAQRAEEIVKRCIDISTLLAEHTAEFTPAFTGARKVAWQAPCTLTHGLKLSDVIPPLLESVGYEMTPVNDAHLCCGSAGLYSVTQPELSGQLRENKRRALLRGEPDLIASANVGCEVHLREDDDVPVLHWSRLLTVVD